MLNFLDQLLEILFAYGIPLIFTLWAIGLAVVALLHLFSDSSWFAKAEFIGLAVCHACACYWFWIWKGEMQADGSTEGYSHVPATISLFIALIVLALPLFLRGVLIPYFVTGAIYLGIVIFGL